MSQLGRDGQRSGETQWERLRWYTEIETNDPDFKLNNNHKAYYSRMYMDDFPEAKGFFRTRITKGEKIRGIR